MNEKAPTLNRICFVLSPIGREGTETHQKFREVLDFVIKPAVEPHGYNLQVLRADDIERSGSFIKDILEYISGAFIVIADLTTQNPNVFYELGVRHALSPRTILIAQTLEEIPSDLREYRTIVYDMTAKGAALFRQRLEKYLKEIHSNPLRADNPVLDRLDSVVANRARELEIEIGELRSQLEAVLREGPPKDKPQPIGKENAGSRLRRIRGLIGAKTHLFGSFKIKSDTGEDKQLYLPREEGDFRLYVIPNGEYTNLWYFATPNYPVDFEKQLADLRILMKKCSESWMPPVGITFIISSSEDLSAKKEAVLEAFNKIKAFIEPERRDYFTLEIWDDDVLFSKEKELGIKVDWSISE